MCFSATVSFGGAAVLSTLGIASMACSRTPAQRVLSGIPIVFSIQQFTEGVLWMALQHPAWTKYEHIATYGFLVFAQMVWPVYVPFAMLLFERDPKLKKIIAGLLATGILLASYIGYCLYQYPVSAEVGYHHIKYNLDFALANAWYYGLLYFLPTILASVISSVKRLRWLGYLFFISYVVARLMFHYFEISVWCFFGSLISSMIIGMIWKFNKESKLAAQS